MRVSALGFARVIGPGKQYALLLNKGRLDHNDERILSPIGGALHFTAEGKADLIRLGVTHFESERDIRCSMPDSCVPGVAAWFKSRTNRETSVLREVTEELVDETEVLTGADFIDSVERTNRFAYHNDITLRPDAKEKQTTYLIEVFDFIFMPQAIGTLLKASQLPLAERWVYFVTRQEIKAGVTHDGVKIGSISKHIL